MVFIEGKLWFIDSMINCEEVVWPVWIVIYKISPKGLKLLMKKPISTVLIPPSMKNPKPIAFTVLYGILHKSCNISDVINIGTVVTWETMFAMSDDDPG